MADPLLAAVTAGDLIGRNRHTETFLIISADCVKQLRNISQAVFPVVLIRGRIDQCLLDVRSRLEIRSTDTEIIYLLALRLQLHLFYIQCRKNFVAKLL